MLYLGRANTYTLFFAVQIACFGFMAFQMFSMVYALHSAQG